MKICITGGSGFIGSKLSELFVNSGHEVLVLDLRPPRKKATNLSFVEVDLIREPVPEEVFSCDAIVHLAGASIFGRWTQKYKKLILDSRVKTASALINAVKKAGRRPKVFVSASAVGYYGDGGENELDEASPAGSDFLASVCKQWEETAKSSESKAMRWVTVRTGIVMGPGGGIVAKLAPVFKWFLGGPIGSGKQWFSWIYIDDLLNVYKTAVLDDSWSGPVNAVSPHPVRNEDFVKALGKALHRPAFIPVPQFVLKLGLGELADAVTMSQKVVPKKLMDMNFSFVYPKIENAVQASV